MVLIGRREQTPRAGNGVLQSVHLDRPRVSHGLRHPAAEAARIPDCHVPLGDGFPGGSRVGDADLEATSVKEVHEARGRATQRQSVRGVGDRAVDETPDSDLAKQRKVIQRLVEGRGDIVR